MEIVSTIVAALALLLTGITYFVHDRKLKKQEILLNDYQLRLMALGEDELKQAVIRAEIQDRNKGNRTVYIANYGKSKATNLRIELVNEDEIYASNPELPWDIKELLPRAHRDILLLLCEGDDEATFKFTWDDEFKKGNTEQQTISL